MSFDEKPEWINEYEFIRELPSPSPRVECRLSRTDNGTEVIQIRTCYTIETFDVSWVPSDKLEWFSRVISGCFHMVELGSISAHNNPKFCKHCNKKDNWCSKCGGFINNEFQNLAHVDILVISEDSNEPIIIRSICDDCRRKLCTCERCSAFDVVYDGEVYFCRLSPHCNITDRHLWCRDGWQQARPWTEKEIEQWLKDAEKAQKENDEDSAQV